MRAFNLVKSLSTLVSNITSLPFREGLGLGRLILCLSLATFGVESAWALRYAGAYVYSSPTTGGYVYVTKDETNVPSGWTSTDDKSENDNLSISDYTFNFWAYARVSNDNYIFKGWATSDNTNSVVSTTPTKYNIQAKATSSNNTSGKRKKEYRYAIFARMTADQTSIAYGAKNVDEDNTATVKLTTVHAGDVNISLIDNNSGYFSIDGGGQYSSVQNEETKTITVHYLPKAAGSHSATLQITGSNGMTTITIPLSGSAKSKAEMSWKPNTNVMNVGDVLTKEALTYSDDVRPIVFTTSDATIIKINDDGHPEAIKTGKATITATQAESDEFYKTEASQEITVTNKQKQLIEWTDKLSFKYEGSQFTQTLTASAHTNITYSLSDVTNSCVSLSGNVLTIKNYGTAYVTATAAETDEYIGVSMTRKVIIRDPSAACETIIYGPSEEHEFDLGWNAASHQTKTQEIDFGGEEPRYVNFDYKGKSRNVGFQYYAGTLRIDQYVNGGWQEVKNLGQPTKNGNYVNTGNITLNRKATKMRVRAEDGMGYMYYKDLTVVLAKYLEVSTDALSFDGQVGISVSKTFDVNYSDVQGPVEIKSSNSDIFSFSSSSFDADCEQHGTKQVTVTLNSKKEIENISETITISNGIEPTQTITVSGKVTKRKQDINWNDQITYYTTDKPTLSATATSGLVISSYSSDNENIAKVINDNQLEFYGSGKVNITAHQDGDDFYEPASLTKEFTINKVTPTIVTKPTASTITYGQKLSESSLTGGQASVQNYRGTAGTHNVEGSFAWTEPDAVHSANSGVAKAYQVTWTPTGTDAALYNSATCDVEVLINRANQTITWETETNISLYTPSASVLNATTTGDGSIVYTIDPSSGDGVGTITDNVLTLHKSGKLVINANAATTANYNAATQVQKTFEVGKRGLTIAWEDKEEGLDNVITTYAAGRGDIGNHFVARDAQTKDVVDIPVTITNSSNVNAISIKDNKLYVDCAGQATITATTAATDQYGASSGTVTLTSLINTPDFEWQVPQPAPNSTYGNFFTSTNKDSDCNLTFTSSNPTLARVEGGKLIVGGNAETDEEVKITVKQNGNCRWKAHEETFTIHVKKPANHVPFTITESNYGEFKTGGSGAFSWDNGMKVGNGAGGFNWDDKTFILHFSGIPDKLSFSYNCTDVSLTVTNAEWFIQESADGQKWSDKNVISSSTSTSEQQLAAPIQLSPTTRYITFCYSGNFAGVFKNINVTELKYFYVAPNKTATEHVEKVDMDTYSGTGDFPVKRTIYLRHANAGSDLKISIGDTKNFRLEYNISTGTDQMGDDPITIIYEPDDFGIHNTSLTIHDGQNADIVIPVYAEAQPGATYTFIGTDGDVKKLENWQVGGITPTSYPNAYHTVVVQQPMVISTEEAFYYLDISSQYPNAKVTIAPTGGLTIGQLGIRDASVDRLIIQSSIEQGKEGQGYLRISPKYTGNMPQATVQLATRSTLDNGANKDATWQYVGIPTATQAFEVDYITWLYEWSEPNGWVNLKNATQPVTLEAWKGYAVTQYGQPTYEWKGQLLREDKTIELTCTTTGSGMNGDNLFANSYSSPIDVKRFTEDDFEGTLDKTFYIFNSGSWNQWNDNKGNMVQSGTMKSTNPGQYIGIPALGASYLEDDLTMIAPMQGVYVYTETGGAKIKLNYTKHVWQASSTKGEMNLPLRAPQDNSDIDALVSEEMRMRDSIARVDREKCEALSHRIRISATSENSGADFLYVLEEENFTHGYDNGYEAPKIMADAEGVLNIYTNEAEAGLMSVAATNDVNEMFIGFNAGEDVNYELYITSVIGDDLELMDMQTGDRFALKDSVSYAFAATPNSEDPYRFRIFKSEKTPVVPTGWTGLGDKAKIWYNKQTLYISDAAANSTAAIYTADGVTLKQVTFNHNTTISTADMPEGVYTVRVEDSVLKFFVKH